MAKIVRINLLTFIFINSLHFCYSQDNIGVNFPFLTWHPGGDKMYFLQPNRLDKNAVFVLNYGIIGHYERYIFKQRLSIKVAQAFYSDCAELFAGHTHLAFRLTLLNTRLNTIRLGFGPTFVYRKSWYRFPDYVQQTKYLKTKGDWQYVFTFFGGEVEYDLSINQNTSINFHIIPGIPDFILFGFGIRYWLNPIPKNKDWKKHPDLKKWFYSAKNIRTYR